MKNKRSIITLLLLIVIFTLEAYSQMISPAEGSIQSTGFVSFNWNRYEVGPGYQFDSYQLGITKPDGSGIAPIITDQNQTSYNELISSVGNCSWTLTVHWHQISPHIDYQANLGTISFRTSAPLPAPILSSTYDNTGLVIYLNWTSVPGAVSYRVYRFGEYPGYLSDGYNDVGNTLSATDNATTPGFTELIPNQYGFAQYFVVAVNSDGINGDHSSWILYDIR